MGHRVTALSAFRLIPSSTLVGCDNGKSSRLRRSVLDDGQRTPKLVRKTAPLVRAGAGTNEGSTPSGGRQGTRRKNYRRIF